jgi:hypothetical protein
MPHAPSGCGAGLRPSRALVSYLALPAVCEKGQDDPRPSHTKEIAMTRTTMKSAIEKILTTHGLLEIFRQSEHYAVKIESRGFMPLSIEKHDKQITVTHYFEQNGDLAGS